MASDTTNSKNTNFSPPRKKTKQHKMVDPRESLGDFDSSIFDASDGHKLVDLIRRKKGLNVQTQKIFDDVPSNRPSLQIEIQRLDQENETLQPETIPSKPIPQNKVDVPSSVEFVPKSPKRSSVQRSITSPIIKMSSTTLGRRTLLKEFEKAFANESRFLPEICSTPISSNTPSKINDANKVIADNTIQKENIICSPIIISDEGSPAEQILNSSEDPTLKGNCTNENTMRSLLNQNELLNALLEQSQKETNVAAVNLEIPSPKSPRRTFSVECDISNGKITLSPSKSKQNNTKDQNTFTKKLTATSEQLKIFKKLGLSLSKGNSIIQKPSRIPMSQKKQTACVPSVLTNQETATAEFVERLQKNATPNCPVIVIPVNQTFNQAPVDRIISNDGSNNETSPLNEITSTLSGNTPRAKGNPSKQKETHKQKNRPESPATNVISSTTISNGEQFKESEYPTINLRWDGIITDDASTSDNSDVSNRNNGLKIERRKISKTKKSQKKNSAAFEKKKISLSYKSLDLHMRVDSDGESESDLPHKSQRQTTKVDEQQRTYNVINDRESDFLRRSQRQTTKVDDQRRTYYVIDDLESESPHKSQRQATTVDDQRPTYNVIDNRESESPHKSQRQTTTVDEQRRTYNVIDDRERDFPRRSQRQTTKVDDQRRTYNVIDDRESESPHKSQRQATTVDDQRRTYNLPQGRESDLPQKSQRHTTKIDDQRRTYNVIDDRESQSPQKSKRQTTKVDDQRRTYNLSQPCREEDSRKIEQILRPRAGSNVYEEHDIHLKVRSHQKQSSINEQDCEVDFLPLNDTDSEEILPHRSVRKSKDDEEAFKNLAHNFQQSKEVCTTNMSQPPSREGTETGEHQGKGREYNLQPPPRRKTSNISSQCNEEYNNNLKKRSLRKTSLEKPTDHCFKERENNFAQQSEHEPPKIDEQRSKTPEHILEHKSPMKTSKIDDNKTREKRLTRQSNDVILKANEKSRLESEKNIQLQPQQKTSNIIEHGQEERSLPRRSRRDISSIDEELSQLRRTIEAKDKEIESFKNLMPPVGFRDVDSDSNLEGTNSISVENDLIDEVSTDKVSLDAFKKPTQVIRKKKGKKPKVVPENVKEYLEVNKKVARKKYLNVSKRKLYSKGNSDKESSDDCSKIDNKSQQQNESLTTKNVDNKERETLTKNTGRRESRLSSNKPLECPSLSTSQTSSKQIRASRSRLRSSHSSSECERNSRLQNKKHSEIFNNNNNESNDKNIPLNSPEPTPKTTKPSKNSKRSNKSGTRLSKKGAKQKSFIKSMQLDRRSSESSPDSAKNSTSRQTNVLSARSRRSFERSQKKINSSNSRNSSNSSRSRSPQRRSTVQTSSIERNSQEVYNKDVDSSLENDIVLNDKTTVGSPTKTIKTPRQSKAHLNSVFTKEVESNLEKDIQSPPPKNRKNRTTKKKKEMPSSNSNLNSSFSTENAENAECGLRRSKREKKPPTAYWACSNSQYTHAFDIYNMLTAGNRKKPYFPEFILNPVKKNKRKNLSTDDNLVANTNEVDSSSKMNKNKTKSKKTNKKLTEPETIENRALQSESETELHRPSVSSECPSTLAQLPELSEEERHASTVKSKEKTKPRSKQKSKHKDEKKLENSDSSAKDSSSDTQNSKTNSKSLSSTDPSLSGNTSDNDFANVQKRRLTTITENAQTHSSAQNTSNTLMPPPKTNLVKKVNKIRKKNTFRTEHDDSIADVSSIHVNNLFDQLKNSSINNSMVNRSRLANNSSGQVSLDSRNTKTKITSKSGVKAKNVSVRLQRMDKQQETPSDVNEKHFDSGFSSEEMNSINTKKDILLDWLVQMLSNGRTTSNKQKGLARFLEPNGYATANIDELTFEEVDGVDFAFYNSPGQKFGYLRFNPRTQKKLSCAKRYELNFVLLGGIIQMSIDGQTFDMKNGDLTTIFIGTSYRMKNLTDDPALVMVIRN